MSDFNGEEIARVDEVPDKFNILTLLLYTLNGAMPNKERMEKIVSEIEDGKWFVSMECLFTEFDYALTSSDGSTKVVARNEDSAFLTKHLRSMAEVRISKTIELADCYETYRSLVKACFKPANPRSNFGRKRFF